MAELELAGMVPEMLRTYQNLYQETKKMFCCLFFAIFDP